MVDLLGDDVVRDATVLSDGTVAEAHVWATDDRVVEFWADPADLPRDLGEGVIAGSFLLRAVRPRRPVMVCVLQRVVMLLGQARRLVLAGRVRCAVVTCLLEGRVGGTAVPAGRWPGRRGVLAARR